MARLTTILFTFLLTFIVINTFGQNPAIEPGGVPGAEVWYKADQLDISYGIFTDHSAYPLQIDVCAGYDYALFNFNPSLVSDGLCLQYRSSLERSLNRSMFIVTEPHDIQDTYPHMGTKYNRVVPDLLGQTYEDSLSMNTYIIETQQGFASRMISSFSQHQNASVHFYSWNNYDINKILKSYGQLGETDFFIGKKLLHPDLNGGPDFAGLMPEYIAFDRQLTENERNRVESYLALKYGITNWDTEHYKSSQNMVFWDKVNFKYFPNNVFGIGRDDVSWLNQLQCESAHARDFLVAATYEILATNADHDAGVGIGNNDFLVFGDTGEGGIKEPNNQNLRLLNKVWLAQVRGTKIKETPIHFRVDLMKAFEDDQGLVDQVLNEELTVWMLHDPNVTNSFVSDFDNGQIKYYKPFIIDFGPGGEVYAHFKQEEILFDQDSSFFDQFNFAIGPECLIQFRPRYNCEEVVESILECYELDIILIGQCGEGEMGFFNEGEEPLEVWFNEEQTEINGDPTYTVSICAPGVYTAIINTGNGAFEFEYVAEIIEQFYVDLGPGEQYLTAQQPEIILDAGQALTNPEAATYQWFFNGNQVYHYGSTLVADQPGDYCVTVTSGDGVCVIEKCVRVLTMLDAQINCQPLNCNSDYEIQITILNGAPPFTTVVENSQGKRTIIHNGDTVINGTVQGIVIITITDSLGAVYVGTCQFEFGSQFGYTSLGSDLTLSSSTQQHTLDASTIVSGSTQNHSFEWLRNGVQMPNTTSQLIVDIPGDYTAKIYYPDDDCYMYASQTVLSVLEGTITQKNDCDEFANTVIIEVNYGFPGYQTVIEGINGSVYNDVFSHSGDISLAGIPYGSYTVTVTDMYGSAMPPQNIEFVDPMQGVVLDLIGYLDDCPCTYVSDDILYDSTGCSGSTHPCVYYDPQGIIVALLDAAQNISSPQDFTYEWFKNGVSMNIFSPVVSIVGATSGSSGVFNEFTLKVTHISSGCIAEDTFVAHRSFDLQEYNPPAPFTYSTTIYPNPSDSDATFYYQISTTSHESFNGTVELFSMLGQLIFTNSIEGQTQYTLPYRLVASGAYIIRTTLGDGTIKVDRVIIK